MIEPLITTSRLALRSWEPGDASRLRVALVENLEHLRPWIPESVYTPAPIDEIAERLRSYALDFAAARAWRFAIFTTADDELVGEASLFPRSSAGRGPLSEADRIEIGYWLRADVTGRGYATEAARALIAAALRVPRVGFVELRCDARNEPSVAVARRLGFTLAEDDVGSALMVWRLPGLG